MLASKMWTKPMLASEHVDQANVGIVTCGPSQTAKPASGLPTATIETFPALFREYVLSLLMEFYGHLSKYWGGRKRKHLPFTTGVVESLEVLFGGLFLISAHKLVFIQH